MPKQITFVRSIFVFTSSTHTVNKKQGTSITHFRKIMHATSKSPVLRKEEVKLLHIDLIVIMFS